jgi:hypothetical protein
VLKYKKQSQQNNSSRRRSWFIRKTILFKGPMKGLDGKMIQPTNKKFHLEFCTIAHWKDGEILEERLFYDQMGMLKQIGAI